jgi:hypothetical protein
MSQERTIQSSNAEDWSAVTLRVTAFLSPSSEVEGQNWWPEIVGEKPSKRQEEPRKGISQEEGPFANGKLILVTQPQRIDWLYKFTEEFEPIGLFAETIDQFIPSMLRWLEFAPSIMRLAFGATLIIPVENPASGNRLFSSFLHYVQIDSENSADLLYQINRPRPSKTDITDLVINRLSKWNVMLLQNAVLSLIPNLQNAANIATRTTWLCDLTLDINTAAEFQGELPKAQLPNLLNELTTLAQEIAREGDIP